MSTDRFPVMRRVLTEFGVESRDADGFLHRGRTPRIVEIAGLPDFKATWITASPWLGKTTVAKELRNWLRNGPSPFTYLRDRVELTELGRPGLDRDFAPPWWERWLLEKPVLPAIWMIDGLDEAADQNSRLLDAILDRLESIPPEHLESLRLVLFSRPHQSLAEFRERVGKLYPRYTERVLREFTLARVDRDTAEALVGHANFSHVLETIRRNKLQSLAGIPVVLDFMKRHPEIARLTAAEVWRGVLSELGGRHQRDRGRPFQTEPEERFDAVCRVAAVLTLTRRETIRDYSPDQDQPTLAALFHSNSDSNRLRLAAREACRTALIQALPEEGAYRFSQRNIQDWLTAFALNSCSQHGK